METEQCENSTEAFGVHTTTDNVWNVSCGILSVNNFTDPTQPFIIHGVIKILSTLVTVFSITTGFYGNGMILTTAAKTRKLRNDFGSFIINLSVADGLMCTCSGPLFLLLIHTDWIASSPWCVMTTAMFMLCSTISLSTLDIVAIHRQARLVHHANTEWGCFKTISILVLLWMFAVILAVTAVLYQLNSLPEGGESCFSIVYNEAPQSITFVVYYISPLYLGTLLIMIVSYTRVATAVIKQGKRKCNPPSINSTSKDSPIKLSDLNGENIEDDNCSRVYITHISLQKHSKALRMCLMVILTIMFCWSPFVLSHIIEAFLGPSEILHQAKICGGATVLLNSAINPYIYAKHSHASGAVPVVNHSSGFGCMGGIRHPHKMHLKVVGARRIVEENHKSFHHEHETNILKLISPAKTRRMLNRVVGPSNAMGQKVFSITHSRSIGIATEVGSSSVTVHKSLVYTIHAREGKSVASYGGQNGRYSDNRWDQHVWQTWAGPEFSCSLSKC